MLDSLVYSQVMVISFYPRIMPSSTWPEGVKKCFLGKFPLELIADIMHILMYFFKSLGSDGSNKKVSFDG